MTPRVLVASAASIDPVRALALVFLAAGLLTLRAGMEAQALADVFAHAQSCLGGDAAALTGGAPATLLGHCGLCWGGAALSLVGAAGFLRRRGRAA